MGLQWHRRRLRHGHPGDFRFATSDGATLQGYIAGISAFQLTYGTSAQRVQDLGIRLDSRQSRDGVSVTPRIELSDGSGHNGQHSSDTWVDVTVLGWVDAAPDPYFGLTGDLAHRPEQLDTPDAVAYSGSLLRAFRLHHGSGPRELSSISTRVHSRLHTDFEHLTALGSAHMADDTGQVADIRSLEAGIIAAGSGSDAFQLRLVSVSTGSTDFGQANDTTTATFDFEHGVGDATALLVAFDLAFAEGSPSRSISHLVAGALDHSATGYAGSTDAPLHLDGNQVTLTSNVSMYDSPSRHQSTLNQATYLIVATPASSADGTGAQTD